MHIPPVIRRPLSLRFLSAMLGTLPVMPLVGPAVMAAEPEAGQAAGLAEKMRAMQDRMSRRFLETWRELRALVDARNNGKSSVSSASVDLREQNDSYTLRISLPGRDLDKVQVSLQDGKQLRIVSPADAKAGAYEQILVLECLAPGTVPELHKFPDVHLVIVHLAKAPATPQAPPLARKAPPEPLPAPPERWDRDILERMEHMRHEMDEMFRRSVEDFGGAPGLRDLFDESRLGSSVDLRDEGGKFIIRAYLPRREMETVKVTVENENVLHIESEETEEKSHDGMALKHEASYSQRLTLPAPVDAAGLMVDRRMGMLIISVPRKTRD
jgi:HSP20 family molecular chaperone IbpA